MQFLHFAFAFGGFFGPLVAKNFVSPDSDSLINPNGSFEDRIFACEDSNDTFPYEGYTDSERITAECFKRMNKTCYNGSVLTITNYNSTSNLTFSENCNIGDVESNFAWAFWICAILLFPFLLALLYFSVTKELSTKCKIKKTSTSLPKEETLEMEDDQANSSAYGDADVAKEDHRGSVKQPLWFKVIFFTLLFLFVSQYIGIEVSYASLIFTAAVKGEVNFTKQDAAVLQSLFWGMFAFMRLFAIPLKFAKIRTSFLIVGNLSGGFLGSLIMVFYPHNQPAIWIGSIILGSSYASMYPNIFTWMSENTEANAKATSVIVAAAKIGSIILPAVVGVSIVHLSPDTLFYITFAVINISSMLASLLFLFTRVYNHRMRLQNVRNRNKTSRNRLKGQSRVSCYKKLQEQGNVSDVTVLNGDHKLSACADTGV